MGSSTPICVSDILNPAIVPSTAASFFTVKLSTSINSVFILPASMKVFPPTFIPPVSGRDILPSDVSSTPVTLCLIEPSVIIQPFVLSKFPTNIPEEPRTSIVAFCARRTFVATFTNSLNSSHFVESKEVVDVCVILQSLF